MTLRSWTGMLEISFYQPRSLSRLHICICGLNVFGIFKIYCTELNHFYSSNMYTKDFKGLTGVPKISCLHLIYFFLFILHQWAWGLARLYSKSILILAIFQSLCLHQRLCGLALVCWKSPVLFLVVFLHLISTPMILRSCICVFEIPCSFSSCI